ncbi:hypothetical protein GGF31_006745 [Allomyces arbusculus]|nr:hypothetical protein GGF31_006745 [Allomyces arbusculus]
MRWTIVANGFGRQSAPIIAFEKKNRNGPDGKRLTETLGLPKFDTQDACVPIVPVPCSRHDDRFWLVAADQIMALSLTESVAVRDAAKSNPLKRAQGPGVVLETLAASLPNVAWLELAMAECSPTRSVASALVSWSAALTSLNLTVDQSWNQVAQSIELPHLRSLAIKIQVSNSHVGNLEALPKALQLASLSVTAAQLHPSAIAQYAGTLSSLATLQADIFASAKLDPPHMPLWCELRQFTGKTTVFFQLAAGSPGLPALESLSVEGWAPPGMVTELFTTSPCPNLISLRGNAHAVAALARCLVAPRLANVAMWIEQGYWHMPVPDAMWPSIQTLSISRGSELLPIMMSGVNLDVLINLTTLTLPPLVEWIDDSAPILAPVTHLIISAETLATFSDRALPSLEHVELSASLISDQNDVGQQPPSTLRSLPAACLPTLERITGEFSMQLAEFLSHMPRLYHIDEAPFAFDEDDAPLAEWRLVYVQKNALWGVIPSMDFQQNHAGWKKIVHMLVVELREFNDVEQMIQEITNVARWCVECRPWVGEDDAVEVRERQRDPFPLEVRVPVSVIDTEAFKHIEAMVQALAADGIVGQIMVAN